MPTDVRTTGQAWAACLPFDRGAVLESLRLEPELSCRVVGESLWVRGPVLTEELDIALRKIPWQERYVIEDAGKLHRLGERLPVGRLPEGPWEDLSRFLCASLPALMLPGHSPEPIALQLVRSNEGATAQALLCPWHVWKAYAESAPALRLGRLHFAVSRDGTAFIVGQPLPPLAGTRFTIRSGIALPLGYRLEPDVDETLLAIQIRLYRGDVALFATEGSYRRIPADRLVPAERATIRAMTTHE